MCGELTGGNEWLGARPVREFLLNESDSLACDRPNWGEPATHQTDALNTIQYTGTIRAEMHTMSLLYWAMLGLEKNKQENVKIAFKSANGNTWISHLLRQCNTTVRPGCWKEANCLPTLNKCQQHFRYCYVFICVACVALAQQQIQFDEIYIIARWTMIYSKWLLSREQN